MYMLSYFIFTLFSLESFALDIPLKNALKASIKTEISSLTLAEFLIGYIATVTL